MYAHNFWMKSCRQKRRFDNKAAAWIGATNSAIKFKTEFYIYGCHYCNGYHLTSKKTEGLRMPKHFKHNPLVETNNEIDTLKQEKDYNNVTEFKLLTGGKEPPTTDANWLSGLEKGTMFLIQDKQNPMDFNLGSFLLREKTDKAVILTTAAIPHPMYVNPVRFCNKYSLFEILAVFDFENETEQTLDVKEETVAADAVDNPKDTT